jgi:hypothetical protein
VAKSNHFYIYYLSKKEFESVIKTGETPSFKGRPYLMVEPIENYDAYSFRAVMLDTPLPGNELPKYDLIVFDTNQQWNYVKMFGLRNKTFYEDYLKKQDGVFTFNGITFYKILDIREMPGGDVQFHFRQLTHLNHVINNTAFMIMPFGDEKINNFYISNVREYLRTEMNIRVVRADDFSGNDVIIETIYKEIQNAEFIICDITTCNKNVFYEIGYAKGINKQLIFIAEKNIELSFFDVNHIRRIDYEMNQPIPFQERLKDSIKTIRNQLL